MNILQVTLGFYPTVVWGGPVKIVHQNAKELVRRGHKVTVYCTNLFDKRTKIQRGTFEREVDGIRVVYLSTWNFPWWLGTLGPIWLPELPHRLREEIRQFDVVHLNGYRNLMNLPTIRAARTAGVPVVMQPHGTMIIIINSFLIKRIYDRLLGSSELDHISAFIALQEYEKQEAIAHGVPEEKIEIIYNGLDPESWALPSASSTFRKRYSIPMDQPLILFLGRINKIKGTDMLIEAFSRLEGIDANLAIVGPDDGQLDEVKRLVSQHHLYDRVFITGLLSGDDVMQAYVEADLFVLPCRADSFPTAIMEACMAKVPIVITEGCEIAHLVKDRIADVVPFDADAFAKAMWRLLTDQQRYARYKANCQQVMQDTFSFNATVDKLEMVYQKLIAHSGKARTKSWI